MSCTQLYQSGRIAGLKGHAVQVVFEPFSGCAACAGGCGIAQLAAFIGAGRSATLQVDLGAQTDLAVGDQVRVGIDAGRLLWLVFVTYVSPLIGMTAGAVSVTLFMPAAGDIGALSGAVTGGLLTAGPLLARAARRRSLDWLGARVTRLI